MRSCYKEDASRNAISGIKKDRHIDWVYFAGTISDDGQNMILANEKTLSAEDIQSKFRFRKGSSAVLSACTGARHKVDRGNPTNMARVFLVSGASCVEGALWQVEDQETIEWMQLMYAFLMADLAVARAQRLAILESKVYQQHRTGRFYYQQDAHGYKGHRGKGGGPIRPPFSDNFNDWAGFVVIGARTRARTIPAGLSLSMCSGLKGGCEDIVAQFF